MPEIIEPDNPEELKSFLAQNQPAEKPNVPPTPDKTVAPGQSSPAAPLTTQTQQPALPRPTTPPTLQSSYSLPINVEQHKPVRRVVMRVAIALLIIIASGFLVLHFWITPNKQSGKTITGKADASTLEGANKQLASSNDPDSLNIPGARQTYSIENGGYRYTFAFLKGASTQKYTNPSLQTVQAKVDVTGIGTTGIEAWVQPAPDQKASTCESDDDFTIRTVKILGQDYPLCAASVGSQTISSDYSAHFLYQGEWQEFLIGGLTHISFSDQLAVDGLNSLKIEKL